MPTRILGTMFGAALFARAKGFEQPKGPSVGEWLNKEGYIHAPRGQKGMKYNINTDNNMGESLENSTELFFLKRSSRGHILYDSIYRTFSK